MKLPELSQCILLQYIDMILDATYNTPDTVVKLGALDLLELFLLILPKSCSWKLTEIRDVLRFVSSRIRKE